MGVIVSPRKPPRATEVDMTISMRWLAKVDPRCNVVITAAMLAKFAERVRRAERRKVRPAARREWTDAEVEREKQLLRALRKIARATKLPEVFDEHPDCARCGKFTHTDDGLEATGLCHPCAQAIVGEVHAVARASLEGRSR